MDHVSVQEGKFGVNDNVINEMIIFEFTKTYVIYCNYFCNMYHGQDAGQLCIGLNTQPFSPNHALLKWTDQSDDALSEIRYEILLLMYNIFASENFYSF